ncbi:hypothetical protein B0I37DRAFT_420559, partial [Chaetomium sp. MPI-CAGE-AT-0009]
EAQHHRGTGVPRWGVLLHLPQPALEVSRGRSRSHPSTNRSHPDSICLAPFAVERQLPTDIARGSYGERPNHRCGRGQAHLPLQQQTQAALPERLQPSCPSDQSYFLALAYRHKSLLYPPASRRRQTSIIHDVHHLQVPLHLLQPRPRGTGAMRYLRSPGILPGWQPSGCRRLPRRRLRRPRPLAGVGCRIGSQISVCSSGMSLAFQFMNHGWAGIILTNPTKQLPTSRRQHHLPASYGSRSLEQTGWKAGLEAGVDKTFGSWEEHRQRGRPKGNG